jgi:hypothetical protein
VDGTGLTHSKHAQRCLTRVATLRCLKKAHRDVPMHFLDRKVIADWRNCFRDIAEILVVRGLGKSSFRTLPHVPS